MDRAWSEHEHVLIRISVRCKCTSVAIIQSAALDFPNAFSPGSAGRLAPYPFMPVRVTP